MKKTRVFSVKKVDKDGNITPYATYVNNFDALYNLTSLCMQLHRVSALWDKNLRAKFEQKIKKGKSGKSIFFEFCDNVYIGNV